MILVLKVSVPVVIVCSIVGHPVVSILISLVPIVWIRRGGLSLSYQLIKHGVRYLTTQGVGSTGNIKVVSINLC